MDVSENNGTPKIIHFNRVFHYKPSILGYPYFWKPPYNHKNPNQYPLLGNMFFFENPGLSRWRSLVKLVVPGGLGGEFHTVDGSEIPRPTTWDGAKTM